jgi:steroid delta-isomerase-like uncharacterized protein
MGAKWSVDTSSRDWKILGRSMPYSNGVIHHQKGGTEAMSTERNKGVVRRWMEEGWNKGHVDLADELYTPNYVTHSIGSQLPPNREGLKQFVRMFRASLPDLQFTIYEMIAEGDKVAFRWIARGTHEGELMDIPPTGRQCETTGISIFRLEDGKIAEDWVNWDQLGFLQQLGVVPAPDGAPA